MGARERGGRGRWRAWIAALALVATGSPVGSTAAAQAEAGPATFEAIDAFVRSEMAASALPGVSYAIVRDGEVVHLAAFGNADDRGRPMTVDTPVVIGSVGKTFTALAIRQLIEAGRVDGDAPVQRYLPWFSLATPEVAAEITIHDLLVHESGLPKAEGQRPDLYRPGMTPEEVVRGLDRVAANRPVGTYEYSNLNFITLGVVVEAVSGQPYADYLREHVFAPLGMERSHAAREPAVADGLAQGHRYLFGLPVAWDEPYPTAIVPAGYQISTASDMARYLAAFSANGRYHGLDIAGSSDGSRNYGIDWTPVGAVAEGYTPGHSGTTLTENTALVYMPVVHLGVVVLANANPAQLPLASPRGAYEIAFDALELAWGAAPLTGGTTVRAAYLVVDTVLLLYAGLLAIEVARLRGWRERMARAARPRLALVPTLVVDLAIPLSILVLLPLLVGSTGDTRPLDVVGTWAFGMWTLPDVSVSLLALSIGLLLVAGLKARQLWWSRGPAAEATNERTGHVPPDGGRWKDVT